MATNYDEDAGFLHKLAIIDGVLTLDGREIKGLRSYALKAEGPYRTAELILTLEVN